MEYTPTLRNFGPAPTADEVSALLEKIGPQARRNCRTEAVSYTHLTLPTTPYV